MGKLLNPLWLGVIDADTIAQHMLRSNMVPYM